MFAALGVVVLGLVPFVWATTGAWPDLHLWLRLGGLLAFAVAGMQIRRRWRRPVTRRQIREYEEWRKATDLADDAG